MATDSPPTKPVTLLDSDLSEMSKNETLKVESEGLFWGAGKTKHSFRSEIEDLTEGRAPTLSNEAKGPLANKRINSVARVRGDAA